MAQIVRSVLLVDYDSLHSSLTEHSALAGEWFAELSGHWLDGLESGDLLVPRKGESSKRRLLVKRCYADPKLLGNRREALIVQGFQVIDCIPLSGRERNAAELNLALDAYDLVGHSATYDEFILVSADTDLTPILFKLRANNRSTAIYAGPATSNSYRAFADAVFEEKTLVALVEAEHGKAGLPPTRHPPAPPPAPVARKAEPSPTAPAPVAVEAPAAASVADEEIAAPQAAPTDRAELVELVRRIHQATKVPVFSARTYAEIFRAITEEIAANGYHFQSTGENVAAKLIADGRNVTRRQIGFVVKGLALKGHAFSAADQPETLAASFREQVLYLASIAPLELTDREKEMISLWITGEEAGTAEPGKVGAAAVEPSPRQIEIRPTDPAAPRAAKPNGGAVPAEGIVIAPGDDVEDSILAAIAEAVDVLVDDTPPRRPATQAGSAAGALKAKAAPVPPPPAAADDDDIGSEIQKILAGYSLDRASGRR